MIAAVGRVRVVDSRASLVLPAFLDIAVTFLVLSFLVDYALLLASQVLPQQVMYGLN